VPKKKSLLINRRNCKTTKEEKKPLKTNRTEYLRPRKQLQKIYRPRLRIRIPRMTSVDTSLIFLSGKVLKVSFSGWMERH
jgi:hypothetical protein